jgi:gliding-associated putative ABC transporter substrate-binding component GldG
MPFVQPESNLEYDISSAIKKMTTKELKKVGFLTGQGEPTLQQLGHVKEMLEKQYQVTAVDLTGGKAVPPDIAVLVVDAPDKPFKSWEKYLIDQYLMKGGRLAFLINKVSANLQNQMGRPENVNLDDLLESYGTRVNTDLIRDVSCAYVNAQQQIGNMVLPVTLPFYYLPTASDFDKSSPVVKDLGSVTFYFVSSVDTGMARSRGYTAQVLARTSKRSGRQEQYFYITPTMQPTADMFKESGIPLAVTLEGAFQSAYGSKPVGVDSAVAASVDTVNKVVSGKLSKIVVVGDGDFLQDQYSGGSKDNFLFASNIVDYLADDIGLASIRSRDSGVKPLDEVTDATRNWIKGINLAVPPLLVLFAGFARWRWRKGVRRRLESRVA